MRQYFFVIMALICLSLGLNAWLHSEDLHHQDHISATADMYLSHTERDLVGKGTAEKGDGQGDQRIQLLVRGLGHTLDKIELEPQNGQGQAWSTEPSGGQWLLLVGERQGVIKKSGKGIQVPLHAFVENLDLYLQNDGTLQLNGPPYQIKLSFVEGFSIIIPLNILP